jgi:hypothetical protein
VEFTPSGRARRSRGEVRGKAQSARRTAPGAQVGPLARPPNQQPARVTASSQGLAVPLRPNTCSAEGIGPRKGKGRAEEAPSLLPRLLWWEAHAPKF